MKRRVAIGAGAVVGAGALLAGFGTALWRRRDDIGQTTTADPPVDVWAQTFESLAGPGLAMRTLRGRPLLLNFWATWCAPCVTEMPLLDGFFAARTASGWQVLALAVDRRPAVERFVAERRLRLPVALAEGAGLDLSRALGNRVSALPFTVAFTSEGTASEIHLGAVSETLLASWAESIR